MLVNSFDKLKSPSSSEETKAVNQGKEEGTSSVFQRQGQPKYTLCTRRLCSRLYFVGRGYTLIHFTEISSVSHDECRLKCVIREDVKITQW